MTPQAYISKTLDEWTADINRNSNIVLILSIVLVFGFTLLAPFCFAELAEQPILIAFWIYGSIGLNIASAHGATGNGNFNNRIGNCKVCGNRYTRHNTPYIIASGNCDKCGHAQFGAQHSIEHQLRPGQNYADAPAIRALIDADKIERQKAFSKTLKRYAIGLALTAAVAGFYAFYANRFYGYDHVSRNVLVVTLAIFTFFAYCRLALPKRGCNVPCPLCGNPVQRLDVVIATGTCPRCCKRIADLHNRQSSVTTR